MSSLSPLVYVARALAAVPCEQAPRVALWAISATAAGRGRNPRLGATDPPLRVGGLSLSGGFFGYRGAAASPFDLGFFFFPSARPTSQVVLCCFFCFCLSFFPSFFFFSFPRRFVSPRACPPCPLASICFGPPRLSLRLSFIVGFLLFWAPLPLLFPSAFCLSSLFPLGFSPSSV